MKKIISMLCVLAMMLSFAVISASAAGEVTISLVKNESLSEGNVIAFDVVLTSTETVQGGTVQLKWVNFLSAGMKDEDFAKVAGTGTINNVAASDMITINFADNNGLTEKMLGTFTMDITNLTADTAFYLSDATNVKKMDNTKFYKADITTVGFTIAAPAPSGPSITYNHSANVSAALGWKGYDEEITDDQIGLGFKYEGVVPSGATAMRWGAVINGERKYSPVINWSEFGIAAGSNVTFYSTYIYGEHNGTPDEAALTAESNALAPSASFKTAAGYVTTEAN